MMPLGTEGSMLEKSTSTVLRPQPKVPMDLRTRLQIEHAPTARGDDTPVRNTVSTIKKDRDMTARGAV
jgi:hypothetical protein